MQLTVTTSSLPIGLDVRENVARILALLDLTNPDELLILPEGAISGYEEDLSFLTHLDHVQLATAYEHIAEAVTTRRAHLVVGSCYWEKGQWWNAALYFAPDGQRFIYRKINLATNERGCMSAGSELPVFPMQFGRGKILAGIQLCREIRFPEQWRYLAMRGAEVFLYLTNAASSYATEGVWRSQLISRAAENQRFLVAANVARPYALRHCPTMMIAPNGLVLAEETPTSPGPLRRTFDLTENDNIYLEQCRTDVVAVKAAREKASSSARER